MSTVLPIGLRTLVAASMLAGLAFPAAAQSSGMSPAVPPSYDTSAIKRRTTPINSSGNIAKEMQECHSRGTQPARDACMQEARNARAAKQRGNLSKTGENYTANALARCRPLSGEYAAACQARVMGFGETSGSVAGGGILRRVETVVVPPGADQVRIQAQTENPVLLVRPKPQSR